MEFVESIKRRGCYLREKAMGEGARPLAPTVIEVDKDNPHKDVRNLTLRYPS
jgi:hypothetical protein